MKQNFSISQLAEEFAISTRTIRFYEEKGLLLPARKKGGQRTFGKKDRARLKLILRGKRFGLSLDEIVKILGKPENKIGEREQIKRAIYYGAQYLEKIRIQIKELKSIEKEMLLHKENCLTRLKQIERSKQKTEAGHELFVSI
jgi:DNA-binding transcriptional MerR regulator